VVIRTGSRLATAAFAPFRAFFRVFEQFSFFFKKIEKICRIFFPKSDCTSGKVKQIMR